MAREAEQPSWVQLEVYCDDEPIRGRVSGQPGRSESFYGWIELVAAIERACDSQGLVDGAEGRER